MATILTAKQKEVIRRILYAVETGGQTYGKQNYSMLIEAGTNTANETAITIGAGQWHATGAKTLLSLIRSTDKSTFNKLDTAGIGTDLDTKNWSRYNISKTSAKAKCIIKIIGSSVGIKCQDQLMEQQITDNAAEIQETYGVMTVDAIAECINIKHHGGEAALKRILDKTAKPYSAKSIKATLDLDPLDKSNNNQVGDYESRQIKVYNMIVTHLIPTINNTTDNNSASTNNGGVINMTENELRSKVANWLVPYIGVSEGSKGHLAIINTYNNSRLCTRYTMTKYDAWCATAVSAAFIACGLAGKAGSGSLFECVECSCPNQIFLAQKQGIWVEKDSYVPEIGDVVMYDWQDSGSGDNTGVADHVGIVVHCNGKTFKVIEGNIGDSVGYRTLSVNGKYIRGFITPKYSKFAKASGSSSATTSKPTTTTTKPTTTVKPSSNTTASSSSGTLDTTCKFKGVTTSDLNVRNWAGTVGTNILRVFDKGTVVEVCDTIKDKDGDDWYYVKESGRYGFCSANYIVEESAMSESVTKPSNGKLSTARKFKGVVTATELNVRNWAGTEYGILRELVKGTTVEVCDEIKATTGRNWYYIKESGKYGFVSAEYVARV